MNKSIIRKIALGFTLFFDVMMLSFWAIAGHWFFFWVFVGINAIVIIGEVVSVAIIGKTLSTDAKHKMEDDRTKRIFIYLAIVSMCLAIASLAVHLGVV